MSDTATDKTEEALAALATAKKEREEACRTELQALLERHRCSLAPSVLITALGTPKFGLDIVAN